MGTLYKGTRYKVQGTRYKVASKGFFVSQKDHEDKVDTIHVTFQITFVLGIHIALSTFGRRCCRQRKGKYLNDIKLSRTEKSQETEQVLTSINQLMSEAAASWWRRWCSWWSLQMPCKFTLWPAELFLQL